MDHSRIGMTLIELLIVMVVIGILAAIAIPKFSETRIRAYHSTTVSDLKNLANRQELYHGKHYVYSTSLVDLEAPASEGVTITVNEGDDSGWAATATHAGVTDGQCGIFYGDASASNGDPATTAGVVACENFALTVGAATRRGVVAGAVAGRASPVALPASTLTGPSPLRLAAQGAVG